MTVQNEHRELTLKEKMVLKNISSLPKSLGESVTDALAQVSEWEPTEAELRAADAIKGDDGIIRFQLGLAISPLRGGGREFPQRIKRLRAMSND